VRTGYTLDQIRTFLVVAGREHVTQAAGVLGLSQSAVTQQVNLLERALGVQLLERVGRNVRLTSAGAEVAGACLVIMRGVENLDRIAESLNAARSGLVSVGVTEPAASTALPAALARFDEACEGVAVEVLVDTAENVCRLVATGVVDCGVVDRPPPAPMESRLLATDRLVVVANAVAPAAHAASLRTRQLVAMRCLLWQPREVTESFAAELLGPLFSRMRAVVLPAFDDVLQELRLWDDCLAVLPYSCIDGDLRQGRLVRLALPGVERRIYAMRRPDEPGPAARAFWTSLIGRVEEPGRRAHEPSADAS
jgi:DNA-binding transcriptional LysR family regulator